MSGRVKRLVALSLGAGALALGAAYGVLRLSASEPTPKHEFFARGPRGPLVIAHRGGAGLWPENTLYAFGRARDLGADVIETDVRATADGALVVMHDATVERTTDGAGAVAALTLARLKRLDAGHRFTPDGGRTFPFRGRGITVPTLEEVFDALPEMRFNIEPKEGGPGLIKGLCRLVRGRGMAQKVLVGSFRAEVLEEFRRECPEVATSAGPAEASRFLAMQRAGLARSYAPAMQALQVPEYAGGVRVLTKEFIEAAHERNLEVHAWTINDVEDMRRLLEAGVDGVMTDYPDRLLALLERAPAR